MTTNPPRIMAPITPVFVDYETYWDAAHSLSKMSPIEYVLSPKTEIQVCSVKQGTGRTNVFVGEDEIREGFAAIDWSRAYVIGHNMSGFDAMIHAWRFGITPVMWGCTLAMARPMHAKTTGLSLAKLSAHYNRGIKNNAVLMSTKGRYLADFTATEVAQMRTYCGEDTDMCAGIFDDMKGNFTAEELWHIDCNIRMLVEPEFELNTGLLQTALSVERSNKHKALLDVASFLRKRETDDSLSSDDDFWSDETRVAEFVRLQMASAAKFGTLLQSCGVDVPMKRSKTNPHQKIPAVAKTDEAMEALLDHDEPLVAAAARARLSTKSTQLETRIQSFLDTNAVVGKLPVPAHYCGADTTGRDSGWLYNMYNLPRIYSDRPRVSDALRNSIEAPKGKVVMVADLSGIELRVNHTLWKVARTMQMWKEKPDADLYKDTAARMYNTTVAEVTKPQRFYAKVLELSAGFGIGGPKFRDTARIQGGIRLTLAAATEGVNFWRGLYPEISDYETGGWGLCQEALRHIAEGTERPIDPWGLCHTEKDGVRLPSGRLIHYPNLRSELRVRHREVDGELKSKMEPTWVYASGRHEAYLYGGKVDENLVQALARDVIFPNALEFWKRTKLRPKHKVYDELVYVVDPAEADDLLAELQSIMRTPPSWWPELVLWSEGDVANTYGAAK